MPDPTCGESQQVNSVWELELRGDTPQGIIVDSEHRPFLYVTCKSGGLVVLKVGSEAVAPQVVARISTRELNFLDAMHLTQRGNRIYLALGDLFAAQGARAGLAVVDVSIPASPKVLGLWTTPKIVNGAAAIIVDEKFAYLGAMSEGIMIVDIRSPGSMRLVSTFRPDPDFPRKSPNKVQRPNARGLFLAGDRLFVAYDAGGLRVLDVSNRARPREIGRYINPAMGKKQQAYNNLVLDGNRLFVAVDYAGLEILDVERVDAIRQIGWWNPWRAHTIQNLWFNSVGHTNQLEFDAKKQLVYLSAGDSELQIVNVSKPKQPELIGHVGQPKNGHGTWGVALDSKRSYLTYMPAIIPFRGTWSGIMAVPRQ